MRTLGVLMAMVGCTAAAQDPLVLARGVPTRCEVAPFVYADGGLVERVRPAGDQLDDPELLALVRGPDGEVHEVREDGARGHHAWGGPHSTGLGFTYAYLVGRTQLRAYDGAADKRWETELGSAVRSVGNLESIRSAAVMVGRRAQRELVLVDGATGTPLEAMRLPAQVDLAARCSSEEVVLVLGNELHVVNVAPPAWRQG